MFEQYPKLGEAYSLVHSLRTFYAKNSIKDAAQLNLARWYNKVAEADFKSFNVIAANIYEHYEDIINFFIERSTNAAAESFNAKINVFRAKLHGVTDVKFFLYILTNIYV